ncbi:MAG: DMT family transporter [Proteobacteria bacterium]|nr:DMT family transporter [Pseudomonadota bacterium]
MGGLAEGGSEGVRRFMIVGILLGLAAALFQSLSYLFSHMFVVRFSGNAVRLLVISHFIMGWFSVALLWFFWPETIPPIRAWAVSMVGAAAFYIVGQGALFLALRRSSASKVAPLLGLKIVILALISTALFGQGYSPWQWAAVAMSVCAAVILNRTEGRWKIRTIGLVLLACVGYCLSDINIKELVGHFAHLGLTRSTVLSVCLVYILLGILSIVFLLFMSDFKKEMVLRSLPYSLTWFTSMLFLFATFASLGVVYGNIVQSTRGVISILIGLLVFRLGYEHLEQAASGGTLARRIGAATLMTGAIALFYLGN